MVYPANQATAVEYERVSMYPTLQPATAPIQQYYDIPNSFKIETLKLLEEANKRSSSILGTAPQRSYYQSPVARPAAPAPKAASSYHFDFSDRSWKMFNNETHIHHHSEKEESSKEKKDDTGLRIVVGLIGLVVAGVAAFCVGKSVAQGEELAEEQENYGDLKDQWKFNKNYFSKEVVSSVDDVVRRTDILVQREQASRTQKIALLVLSFIGGGTAVAGALMGSSVVMLTAAAIGSCVVVASLFKLGYACFSNRDEKEAKAIQSTLSALKGKISISKE